MSGELEPSEQFVRLHQVPPYTRDLGAKGQIRWSAAFEVPVIGDDIVVRLNGIGRAKVVGYATHCGYLGVMCVPYAPPKWWLSQNGLANDDNPALAYGAEIALIEKQQIDP